jgi:hypothetical protein
MLLAFLLMAAVTDWVPARWISSDPAAIPLIQETPVNCVLLEQPLWSAEFASAARSAGIATLGVVRPEGDLAAAKRMRDAMAQKRSSLGLFAEPATGSQWLIPHNSAKAERSNSLDFSPPGG